jgi:hypothetical protein
MRVAIVSAFVVFVIGTSHAADRPDNLVPLTRFYDTAFNQHIYTHNEDEAAKWRKLPHVKEHETIGDVATHELPGTVPLWRAVRIEGKQSRPYYYLRTTDIPQNTFVDAQVFKAYVWTKPGDGRIPIYCTTWTDSTDAFLHAELKVIRNNQQDTKKSTGVLRRGMGGKDISIPLFYVYPHSTNKPESPE